MNYCILKSFEINTLMLTVHCIFNSTLGSGIDFKILVRINSLITNGTSLLTI